MKNFLKNILFYLLYFLKPKLGNGAVILMYHSIGEEGGFSRVKKINFEKQIKYLSENNFNVVKLSELIRKIKHCENISNCVCVNLDDGCKDNYEKAFPILKKYNLPASIFVATDFIGGNYVNSEGISLVMLDKGEIKEMSESGLVEILPHTAGHLVLNKVGIDRARKDIEKSREAVKEITGKDIQILSYPKGRYSEEVIDYLKKNGWQGAVTVKEGVIKNNDDLFKLKRNAVNSLTTFIQFKGKISGAIELYEKMKLWKKF